MVKRSFLIVLLVMLLGLTTCGYAQDFRDREVDEAIKKAQAFLLSRMNNKGYWPPRGEPSHKLQTFKIPSGQNVQFRMHYYPLGPTAIAVYALIESGVSPDQPQVAKALEHLLNTSTAVTYVLSLRANAYLAAIKRTDNKALKAKLRKALRQDAEQLIFSTAYGGYFYPSPGDKATSWSGKNRPEKEHNNDNSNSQYAVYGVWAAARDSNEIPKNYWKVVKKHWVDQQKQNGTWPYNKDDRTDRFSATMTTAGLATMFICFDVLNNKEFLNCRKSELPKTLTKGLEWFEKNYSSFQDQIRGGYLLYGIERVGLASGYKYFGKADWYKIGRKQILRRQKANGSFDLKYYGDVVTTSYGLLFLSRGRNPVILNKLEFQGDWNNRPRDAANLCRQISRDLERELSWQIINLRVPAEELHDAPILYISGSKAPKFTEEELQKLRDFVHQGGLILSVTECNGAGFKAGIRKVYAKLFPEYEMKRCDRTHPLYSLYYKISNGRPIFFEITNGVRPLVLHTDTDLSRAWQMNTTQTQHAHFDFFLKILMYTVGDVDALRPRGVSHWPGAVTANTSQRLKVARLGWAGNCNPEPLAQQRLQRMMAKDGDMTIEYAKDKEGELMIPISKLADSGAQLAWLTGTGKLNLSEADEAALKQFVEKGGVLLIDAAGGNKPFAKSARTMLKRLFDKKFLDIFEKRSPIYNQKGHVLDIAKWQKITQKRLVANKQYRLEGVLINDKPAVIFSPEDITAGLLGTPFGAVDGYAPSSAFELVRNICHYAATKATAD